ncbi:MAG: DegT/DnrJ/EryC1/StrS family aminotransferase [Pseudomonadota bacterium]
MMTELGKVVRHQAGNLLRLARGTPMAPVPMGSMTLDLDDVAIARECLDRPEMVDDAWTARFEARFADVVQTGEAVAFRAGRVALSAILDALDIGPADEVIVPGYTCVVVPNAVLYRGATPVYCDIELETYGADLESIRQSLSDRTRAIVVQHLYGLVCRDYEAILSLAAEHGIAVIEDCAHSTGAKFRGVPVGLHGDAGFFSSEQTKVINTTCGGIAVSRRPEILQRLRNFQNASPAPDQREVQSALQSVVWNYFRFRHPQRWWRGDVARLRYGRQPFVATGEDEMAGREPAGYRGTMSAAIARVGCNQLDKLQRYNERRRRNARHWEAWCEEHGFAQPRVIAESEPVFLRYPVLVDAALKRSPANMYRRYGVWPGVWFKSHLHPSTREVSGCPTAATAVEQCVNLPCLTDDD